MWTEVYNIILKNIINLIQDPDRRDNAISWLNSLKAADDGERLGICIAIDVLSKSIDPVIFAQVFELLDTGHDARQKFYIAMNEFHTNHDDLIAKSNFNQSFYKDSPKYLRVMKCTTFVNHYLNKNNYPISRRDSDKIRQLMFRDLSDMIDLPMVKGWSGANERVWLIPEVEFKSTATSMTQDMQATFFNNSLGLGYIDLIDPDAGVDLFFFEYPDNFKELEIAQPTAFDSDWYNYGGFYLSFYEENGWGLTHPCSSNKKTEGTKERIHRKVDEMENMRLGYLGKSKQVKFNYKKLLQEGYGRFNKVKGAKI